MTASSSIPSVEFTLAFTVLRWDYGKAVCWSRNPPACSFEFPPSWVFSSPLYFRSSFLQFIILTVYAFGKKRRETALISASAGIAVLIGIVLLTVDEKIAPLTVLLLAPLLQWAGEKVLEIQPDRNDETIWAVAAVLSFLAVWIVVRMSFGRSI
ncbi:hypothetical protein [Thermococcus sp.]|uniref:hypothetical protein n=1 Tax=Thermococcus sp. TaxID=35749 RepID=UPI0026299BBA|nr:hypothetical protein [Thermococcus sp.]